MSQPTEEELKLFKLNLKKEIEIFFANEKDRKKNMQIVDNVFAKTTKSISLIRVLYEGNDAKQPKKNLVSTIAGFLWTFESYYANLVDLLCYILIYNGHDLYNVYNREFAKTIDEIDAIDISTKCNFLKEHSFGIMNRSKDRELRNKIAHQDFEILEKSGSLSFIVNGETIDIEKRLHLFMDFNTNAVVDTFIKSAEELTKETAEKYGLTNSKL